MIANVKTNQSFRQTTRYVVEKEKAKIIGGNMVGQTVSQLVAEFLISAHLNPSVKNPCYHLMLSLPKQETLSDSLFAQMGTKFFASLVVLSRLTGDQAKIPLGEKRIKESELNEQVENFLNLDIHQYSYFIARHHDRDHQHIHIVASRLNEITGKAIQTWQNYPKGEYAARLLEKQFLLTSVLCSWQGKTKALTRSQRDRVEKDGLPGAEIMRRAIDEAIIDQPTMPELIERLSHQGIVAEVTYHPTGQVRGIRYSILVEDKSSLMSKPERKPEFKRLTLTGSGLNRHKYSFFKLQSELGVSYVPERDDDYLKTTMGKAQDLSNFSLSAISPQAVSIPLEKPMTVPPKSPLEVPKPFQESQSPSPIDSPMEDESLVQTPQNSLKRKLQASQKDSQSTLSQSTPQNPLNSLTDAQLLQLLHQLQQWQKKKPRQPNLKRGEEWKNYQTWLDAPQTQTMQKLEQDFSSPSLSKRIQQLHQGYTLYAEETQRREQQQTSDWELEP